jgi:proline iminopeptidase
MAAAKAWALWEAQCNTLNPCEKIINHFIEPGVAHPMALLECHYFLNHCFLKPNQILKNMEKIGHIPGIIIHGRYDMVSLLENSYRLHQHWQKSELTIVRDAGHSLFEAPTVDAVVRSTQHFAEYLLK